MTTEELGSVLERVEAMCRFVTGNPVMLAALAFMLNRFDRYGELPSLEEIKEHLGTISWETKEKEKRP